MPARAAVSSLPPHLQRPNARTHTRASGVFRFFAFTSSPKGDKKLRNKGLSVKASPHLPSPVKH